MNLQLASDRATKQMVLAVVLLATLALGGPARALQSVDLELVLAVDVSGSVDYEEAELQRNGYVAALRDTRIIEAIGAGFLGSIAVTFVEWADPHNRAVIAPWTWLHDKDSVHAFARRLAEAPRTSGRYTSISGAIEFAMPLFDDNGFEGTRRVIDISGDGPNNTGGLVTGPRDRAVSARITINGLPIVNDRPGPFGMPPMPHLDRYFENCVIGGPRAFIVIAEDHRSFADAIRRKLLIEIADAAPEYRRPTMGAQERVSVRLVATRAAPPCDEGERLMEQRRRRWDEF